jgi:hypothetical protein
VSRAAAADRPDHCGALAIANIDVWSRLDATTRQVAAAS